MLTLDNFEQQLSKDLLKKALPYFKNGSVLYVDEGDDGTWHAEVDGSDTYSVEITLDKRTITDSFCDCPVESDTCKHVVAVLFALREELKKQGTKPKKAGRTPKKFTVAELVKQVSADELRAFLIQYAVTDKTFSTRLQLHFADKDERIDVGKHYTTLIKKIVQSNAGKYGYIDYRATFKVAKEIEGLLANGVKLIGQKNYKDALTLGMVVLRETMDIASESDDSAGNIGGALSSAVDLLRDIGLDEDTAPPLRRELFDTLANEIMDKRYFDYGDVGLWILDVLYKTALRLPGPDVFLSLIDRLLPLHSSKSSTFYPDYLRTIRMKFLRDIGRTDEANRQMQANMDIVAVRAQAVDEAIQSKKYDRAKTLIQEGIQLAEAKNHPGVVSQWEQKRLEIAEAEQDTAEIRRLTKHFAFDRWFNAEYFRRWKATFLPSEWTDEYRLLVENIRSEEAEAAKSRRPGWGYNQSDALLNRLGPILIEEKQWPDLLALIQQSPRLDALKQALPYLAEPFPDEMLALFLPAIRNVAESASTRPDYKNVASLITLVRKAIPTSRLRTDALIHELQATYIKRPAMQDELQNIK